eukprot:TRINITY_DN14026_c0_g1_i2.p1 TRINITY_DN14026_c0_g1~~TRINITY_DN14026_c0_g1_i2.p1  ORF type:complete len:157 (-),score=26.00 TRINITY_DN14026_c0_g1_i2:11-481(-)
MLNEKVEKGLSTLEILAYAMGHVLNDMVAACWFTYLLVLLTVADKLAPTEAGLVVLVGQVADGLATPVVGLASDMSRGCPALRLGRRKLWYVIGTIVMIIGYYFIFAECLPYRYSAEPSQTVLTIYNCLAAAFFNLEIGRAVQQECRDRSRMPSSA